MLEGWYCRSIANEAAQAEEEERVQEESRLKKQYKFLKGKFKHLLYVRLVQYCISMNFILIYFFMQLGK